MEEGLKFECEFVGEDGQVKDVRLYAATEVPNNQVVTYITLLSLVTPGCLEVFGDCESDLLVLRSGQRVLECDDDVINVVSSAVKVGQKVVKLQAVYSANGNGSDWEILSDWDKKSGAGSQADEKNCHCGCEKCHCSSGSGCCDNDCECGCCNTKPAIVTETHTLETGIAENSEKNGFYCNCKDCECTSGCECESGCDPSCCSKVRETDVSSLVVKDEQVLETDVAAENSKSCDCGCGCDCGCDCKTTGVCTCRHDCDCGCDCYKKEKNEKEVLEIETETNTEVEVSKLEEGLLNVVNDATCMEANISKFGEALMDMVQRSEEQSKIYEFSGDKDQACSLSLEADNADHKSMATLGCFNDGVSEWTQPSFMTQNSPSGCDVNEKYDVKSAETENDDSKSFEDGASSFLTAALKDIEKLLGAEDNEMNEKFKNLLATLSTVVSEVLSAAGVNPNNMSDSASECTENINVSGLLGQILKLASDRDAVMCIQRFLATSAVTDMVVDLATNEACTLEQIRNIIMNHLGDILPEIGRLFRQAPQVLVIVPQLLIWLVAAMKLNVPTHGSNNDSNSDASEREMVVIHENIICDGCESSDEYRMAAMRNGSISGQYIRGIRYKSAIVQNYDLCASCEASGDFEQDYAPFLKINTPSKAPREIVCVLSQEAEPTRIQEPALASDRQVNLACPTNGHPLQRFVVPNRLFACDVCDRRPAEGSTMYGCRICDWDTCQTCAELNAPGIVHAGNATSPQAPNPSRVSNRSRTSGSNTQRVTRPPAPAIVLDYQNPSLRPRAKFIADVTIPDGSVVRPGEKFTKIWKIKNSCENGIAWPNQCRIVCVGGDMMGCSPGGVLVAPLPAGSVGDICVDLTAPSTPGRYVGYWRLITPSTSVNPGGVRFGQRLWIDLAVSDAAPAPPMSAPQPVTSDDDFAKWGEQLQKLAEMDFLDCKKNVELLEEEEGNMTKVIERLLLD